MLLLKVMAAPFKVERCGDSHSALAVCGLLLDALFHGVQRIFLPQKGCPWLSVNHGQPIMEEVDDG